MNRLPPTEQLATPPCRCNDAVSEPVTRAYKLDSLSYVGEGASGALVAQTGQMPVLIKGLPHSLKTGAGIVTSRGTPLKTQANDDDGAGAEFSRQRSKSADSPPKLEFLAHGWSELKAGFSDSFGPFLDRLAERASRTWKLRDLIEANGEGFLTGTTRRVALLSAEAEVRVAGDGAEYVEVSIDEGSAGATLVLRALDKSVPHELEFDVHLGYANGEQERLRFFVVSPSVPSNTKAERGRAAECGCGEAS